MNEMFLLSHVITTTVMRGDLLGSPQVIIQMKEIQITKVQDPVICNMNEESTLRIEKVQPITVIGILD